MSCCGTSRIETHPGSAPRSSPGRPDQQGGLETSSFRVPGLSPVGYPQDAPRRLVGFVTRHSTKDRPLGPGATNIEVRYPGGWLSSESCTPDDRGTDCLQMSNV